MRKLTVLLLSLALAVSATAATKKVIQPKDFPTGRPFSPGILVDDTLSDLYPQTPRSATEPGTSRFCHRRYQEGHPTEGLPHWKTVQPRHSGRRYALHRRTDRRGTEDRPASRRLRRRSETMPGQHRARSEGKHKKTKNKRTKNT